MSRSGCLEAITFVGLSDSAFGERFAGQQDKANSHAMRVPSAYATISQGRLPLQRVWFLC